MLLWRGVCTIRVNNKQQATGLPTFQARKRAKKIEVYSLSCFVEIDTKSLDRRISFSTAFSSVVMWVEFERSQKEACIRNSVLGK